MFYSCWAKANFSSVILQCYTILSNIKILNSNMLICCLRNIFHHQLLLLLFLLWKKKQLCCLIFLWKLWDFFCTFYTFVFTLYTILYIIYCIFHITIFWYVVFSFVPCDSFQLFNNWNVFGIIGNKGIHPCLKKSKTFGYDCNLGSLNREWTLRRFWH